MYDVFISYTTRIGGTTREWVSQFADELKKYYNLNYSRDLRIWHAREKLDVGDDYQKLEFKAIEQSLVFLMILNPGYLSSPETNKELEKYQEVRATLNEPENYISVLTWRGNKEAQLTTIVNSNLLFCKFSEFNTDGNEQTYPYNSEKYINGIQNIAKGIRKREFEESGKINSKKIIDILSKPASVPTIYVTNTNDNWQSPRSKFVNELIKTLERRPDAPVLRILPDYFASGVSDTGLTNDDLQDLLSENNTHGGQALQAMLNASSFAIVAFLVDNTNAAETLLPRIEFQLAAIKNKSTENNLPVSILSHLPDDLSKDARFSDFFNNAPEGKIKVFNKVDINTFIQSYLVEINVLFKVKTLPPVDKVKHIYVVEYYGNADKVKLQDSRSEEELKDELENRKKLRRYLLGKNFLLMRNVPVDMDLAQTARFHKECLMLSDFLIIYRGIREESYWCSLMQHNTYTIIHDIEEETNRHIKAAVYVDPLQEEREEDEYNAFGFSVIVEDPQQLEIFLWAKK